MQLHHSLTGKGELLVEDARKSKETNSCSELQRGHTHPVLTRLVIQATCTSIVHSHFPEENCSSGSTVSMNHNLHIVFV